METKSSNVLVGGVVIGLIVLLFGFILWLARVDPSEKQRFDIFFKQSVAGLAVGSQVQFAGVPVGAVERIALMPDTPEFVRVRITVNEDTPILQGTTATLEGVGFTGVSVIQLDGAIKGAPPIVEPGPFDVPVIPTRPGALGQLLSSAPEFLNRVSTLTERLGEVLDARNRQSIAGILANTERVTGAFADRSDEIAATVAEARFALKEVGRLAGSTSDLIDKDGRPLVADLRQTVARADRALAALENATKAAQPAIETVNTQTLPEIGLLVRDLREVTANLGAISAKLDEDPAGALVGGRTLPEYEPK
jgi:phospholipid/cholesterol/gamma-HCH transport system substrate-binding protein